MKRALSKNRKQTFCAIMLLFVGVSVMAGCGERPEATPGSQSTSSGPRVRTEGKDTCTFHKECEGEHSYCLQNSEGKKECRVVDSKLEIDGNKCRSHDDCIGEFCLQTGRWKNGGGYCTTPRCTTDDDCANPKDATFLPNRCYHPKDGEDSYCVRSCDREDQCRVALGYLCEKNLLKGGRGACFPGQEKIKFEEQFANEVCHTTTKANETFLLKLTDALPAGTTSYAINGYTLKEDTKILPKNLLADGSACAEFEGRDKFMISTVKNMSPILSLLVPMNIFSVDRQIKPGKDLVLQATLSQPDTFCATLLPKKGGGKTIDFNIYFVGTQGLNAQNAATHEPLKKMLDVFRDRYAQVGVTLGNVRYINASDEVIKKYSTIYPGGAQGSKEYFDQIKELLKTSTIPKEKDEQLSLDVFLVKNFALNGIIGYSAGIPGPGGIHGSRASGVVFTTEYLDKLSYKDSVSGQFVNGAEYTGNIVSHEVGHFLGLFHTTEKNGVAIEKLSDTPECTLLRTQPTEYKSCPDLNNLMFYIAWAGNKDLTPEQGKVIKGHPLIKGN